MPGGQGWGRRTMERKEKKKKRVRHNTYSTQSHEKRDRRSSSDMGKDKSNEDCFSY